MSKLVFRCAFFLLPLAAAAWAGCSDDGPSGTATDDAGPEGAAPDVYVPPVDAAKDAAPKRDCAADLQADGVQKHLDCTGLYSDFDAKIVAAENEPYTPGVQFWSDGAAKSRFLYLPPGTTIDISDFDEWKFPNGTKVWKEFVLEGKRIETRLFMKLKNNWVHTTYRWNDAGTDAVRKDNGELVPQAGKAAYEIPNTGQCDVCHGGRRDQLLGLEAVSLGLPTAQGLTLASLAAKGRLSATPPVTTFTLPDDASGKAAPALAWVHANCGGCHNSNPGAAAFLTNMRLLLRPSQLLPEAGTVKVQDLDTYLTTVNVDSSRQNADAGTTYKRIAPHDPQASLTSLLSGRRVPAGEEPSQDIQMPPIVTRQVDTTGHALLDAWINALP